MKKGLAIVLTATIVPNAILTEHTDVMLRRAAYLEAIDCYQKYADVYFLENSTYDLASDKDFFKYSNVHIRKFAPSKFYEKGKGYQEFEMLDNWLSAENPAPARWIKITGRYSVSNINKIFAECFDEDSFGLIIEQKLPPNKVAHTDVFYITTDFYRGHFLGIHKLCDDAIGVYIEHVVRGLVRDLSDFRLFHEMPLVTGISGSTGLPFGITLKKRLRSGIGRLMYRLNRKYRVI